MAWLLSARRSAPLWLRLGLPISLIIALAIGFISFLNYYNYRKTYQELNVARIMVVARDLRQAINRASTLDWARAATPNSRPRLRSPRIILMACGLRW